MLSLESVLMITDINKLKKQLRIIFDSLDDDYSQYSNDYRVSSYETYRIDEILHTREGKEFIKEVVRDLEMLNADLEFNCCYTL